MDYQVKVMEYYSLAMFILSYISVCVNYVDKKCSDGANDEMKRVEMTQL